MKRYGCLYDEIISMENLRKADMKARRGKREKREVREHDAHREEDLRRLHEELKAGVFKTSPYRVFRITEPKEREIYCLPYYPDRIVHHAIVNVAGPIWERTMTHNTYACIRGRGMTACARRVRRIMDGYRGRGLYCLKTDIRKYYPSVKHDILKRIVRRKIKDGRLLSLLDEIIDSAEGLPIGNFLCQPLGNLYLAYMMHWVNEELGVDCTEYADDIVFFAETKERLHEVRRKVAAHMEEELGLRMKGNWQVFPVARNRHDRRGRGLDYVGFVFYREETRMRKGIKKNMCRRAAAMRRAGCKGEGEWRRGLAPWLGWAEATDGGRRLVGKITENRLYNV